LPVGEIEVGVDLKELGVDDVRRRRSGRRGNDDHRPARSIMGSSLDEYGVERKILEVLQESISASREVGMG
jgi:hypothetical protein